MSGYPAGRGGVGYHALRQSKLICIWARKPGHHDVWFLQLPVDQNVNTVVSSMSSSCLYEPRVVARVPRAAFHSNEVKLCFLSLLSDFICSMYTLV